MEFHYEFVNPNYLLVNLNYLESIDAFTFTRNMLPHAKMIETYSQTCIHCIILPPNHMPEDKTLQYPYKNYDIPFESVEYYINYLKTLQPEEPIVVFVQIPDKSYLKNKENANQKKFQEDEAEIEENID